MSCDINIKLREFNEALLRLIDNVVNSKIVEIMGWASISYLLINTYLNNFALFILFIKLFFFCVGHNDIYYVCSSNYLFNLCSD